MATLAYNAEEIAPRELKPALYELEGISREAVEAHYKLYEGYIAKRNEILARLADVDLESGNQVYSDVRALKVDLTFAIGGVKNHEIYFEHLGGDGGDPSGPIGDLIERDFGGVDEWRADLKATGMGGRGWAWTAYDWDEGRLFNYIGDAQNSYPIWNATPLVALDVYEHAYFLDYRTDRAAYIDAYFQNLDWATVNNWVSGYGIPLRSSRHRDARLHPLRIPGRQPPVRVLGRPLDEGRRHPDRRQREHRRDERVAHLRAAVRDSGHPARRREGVRARSRRDARGGPVAGALAGGAAMLGHWRPLFLGFAKGGKMVATCGGALLGLAPLVGLVGAIVWIAVFALTRYASVASIVAALSLPVSAVLLGEPWPVLVFASAAALGVLVLHRGNLARLRAGTETRTHLRRKPATTT